MLQIQTMHVEIIQRLSRYKLNYAGIGDLSISKKTGLLKISGPEITAAESLHPSPCGPGHSPSA